MKQEKVPNILILVGLVLGLVYRWQGGEPDIMDILSGILLPVLLFWPLFLVKAMGAGDIKLMSVMGLYMGWRDLLWAIAFAIIFAAVAGLVKSMVGRDLLERLRYMVRFVMGLLQQIRVKGSEIPPYLNGEEKDTGKIHFAVALLLGGVVVMGGLG